MFSCILKDIESFVWSKTPGNIQIEVPGVHYLKENFKNREGQTDNIPVDKYNFIRTTKGIQCYPKFQIKSVLSYGYRCPRLSLRRLPLFVLLNSLWHFLNIAVTIVLPSNHLIVNISYPFLGSILFVCIRMVTIHRWAHRGRGGGIRGVWAYLCFHGGRVIFLKNVNAVENIVSYYM